MELRHRRYLLRAELYEEHYLIITFNSQRQWKMSFYFHVTDETRHRTIKQSALPAWCPTPLSSTMPQGPHP